MTGWGGKDINDLRGKISDPCVTLRGILPFPLFKAMKQFKNTQDQIMAIIVHTASSHCLWPGASAVIT